MTDLPFAPPDEASRSIGAPEARRHVRHDWIAKVDAAGEFTGCRRCDAIRDEVRSRRGKSSRNRGNRRERELAAELGGKRTGHFGGPDDVMVTGLFVVQSKVRAAFPSWMTTELAKLPRTGGLTPLLIVTGPGRPRRSIVVLELRDWIALHGPLTRSGEVVP